MFHVAIRLSRDVIGPPTYPGGGTVSLSMRSPPLGVFRKFMKTCDCRRDGVARDSGDHEPDLLVNVAAAARTVCVTLVLAP